MLLSKKSMKKFNAVLYLKNNVVWILGQKQKRQFTDSGHYYILLIKPLSNASKEKTICEKIWKTTAQMKKSK